MVNQVGVQEDLAEHNQSVTDANQFPFTKEQCQQFLAMLGNQMQAAQFNMGNKEVHMAGNVIKTHPESQATRQQSVSQSSNVLNMSESIAWVDRSTMISWDCLSRRAITKARRGGGLDLGFDSHERMAEYKIAEDEVISGDEDKEPSDALRLAKGKMKMVS
nr:hypothetical protein CFP56_77227 [Quercus suber]